MDKCSFDNIALLKIIEEIKEELAFIREEFYINISGPCSKCNRRWFTSPRTGQPTPCAVCNEGLCPTCPKSKCSGCTTKVCPEHYHKCEFCRGFCTECMISCEICGNVCRNIAGNRCDYLHCTSCPKHSPLNAIGDNLYLCKDHYPIETAPLPAEPTTDFL